MMEPHAQTIHQQDNDMYYPPALAYFFHAFPHLNITCHLVNATFDPDSNIYLESLGILGSLPAAWLILTLLVLLIYLLTRCCDRKPRPKHSIVVLKWTLAIFTLLCCAAIGVGLYGNDDVHNGLVQFVLATQSMDDIITAVKNQTGTIEATLTQKVDPLLTELGDVFGDPVANQTARKMVFAALSNVTGNTRIALLSVQDISGQLKGVSLRDIVSIVQTAEGIRWPVTMAVLSILLMFCVVLLFGVARHSRCALITFSVFGLFAVIISWLLSSLYLATAVALGDLCMSPDGFLEREAATTPKADILNYYIRCDQSRTNPFFQRLRQGQNAVKEMSSNLVTVARIAKELYKPADLHPKLDVLTTDINQVDKLATGLSTLLDCKNLHRQYLNATRSVCDLGLYGLSFMLAASVAAGFFFTVLVWVDSHTWIYIRRRRDYLQVDEQDPFLPPSAASQAIAARTLRSQGSYGSTGYFRHHHHSPHHHHHTPPPTPPYPGTLDGRSSREEKSQHSSHHESGLHSGGGSEHYGSSGASAMLGPNHGQYATLSKQCKTLESSDFY
ncbi:protein tweety isoform X1 [Cryptotermes secundus]|uniref:protein tweety isoform X1 n=1 Tax=Cryptotermes secundus TaxID=105785 RepID=UPI000CD7B477|nr:protein tweety isoform X1 [Cryptotermes secundus]XP_023717741.1 protein tweety isoform X1 [Cryptotermes secundus]XP_023717742.1 protein tweety isoform X1 [Cryptotermes secundus]XP_023717743.1 protein tweety isoform X1 [Cryptotermes secundus]